MSASASISATRLEIVPGGRGSLLVTVRNTGSVVDEFTLTVLGAAAAWATVTPSVIPLFPGAEGTAEINFAVPLDSRVATGDIDVAVKVTSKEDPDGSTVEEAVLAIGSFDDVYAELVPRTSHGSRSGHTELAIDNRGNARLDASLAASDADGLLTFELDPPGLVVDPGKANFARVNIRPVKRFLRGPEKTIPFKVLAKTTTEGVGTLQADGMFIQRPILPRWLLRLLVLLLLGLLALFLLWQLAFKPVIRSTAREAAKANVKEAASDAAKQTAEALGATPGSTGKPAGTDAGADASGATKTTKPGEAGASDGGSGGGDDGRGGVSADKRLEVEAAPGATASGTWAPAPDEKTQFNLTDIVLQNPKGDVGLIRIKRGDDVLLESALENFRDLDFHFVAPYVFKGQELKVEVECKNAEPAGACKAAATLTGFVKKA